MRSLPLDGMVSSSIKAVPIIMKVLDWFLFEDP